LYFETRRFFVGLSKKAVDLPVCIFAILFGFDIKVVEVFANKFGFFVVFLLFDMSTKLF